MLVNWETNENEGFTGVIAFTKSGQQLKPMAIFLRLQLFPNDNFENISLQVTWTGKMNNDIMKNWCKEVLVSSLNKNNIQNWLFFMHEYQSHKTDYVINHFERTQFQIFPSGFTSLFQPPDVNFFIFWRIIKNNL